MAVKGTAAKAEITEILLKVFDGAFINGKEVRIPWNEDGETIEIKVTLTAAKDIIGSGTFPASTAKPVEKPTSIHATPEEKKKVEDLASMLGLI